MMEVFGRNQLFKMMLLALVIYPMVPAAYTPWIGFSLGLFFLLYLMMHPDAYEKIRRGRRHNKLAYGLSSALFILWSLVSFAYSVDRMKTLEGILMYSSAFVLFFILKYELHRPNQVLPLVRAYFLGTFMVGLYHGGQVLYEEIVQGISFDPLAHTSFFDHGPVLAYFMLLPLFPALALYIFKEKTKESRFYFLVASVSVISIFMTGSRIAIIGIFIGLALLSLLYSLKFLLALLPAGIFMVLIPIFSHRHRSFFAISEGMGRISFYLEIIKAHWSSIFFGRGFFTMDGTMTKFLVDRPELLNLGQVNRPYNTGLQVLLELGLVGLFIGGLILFFKMKGILNYTKSYKAQANLKVMYVGVFVSMAVLLYVGAMDSYMMDPKLLYAIAALMGILHGDAKWKGIGKV